MRSAQATGLDGSRPGADVAGLRGRRARCRRLQKRHHIGQRSRAHRVIDDAFTVAEHAVQDGIGARRQLARHLAFPPPQYERV